MKEKRKKIRTLPEGEKDDWLDHEELEHRIVRNQQLTCGEVEEEECVERQTDGDVVDYCDVQVATRHTDRNKRQKHFNLIIAQNCSKQCKKKKKKQAGTYLKSPSLYFPKAWRMTVIMAIRGFTTQNCRVAWRRKRLRLWKRSSEAAWTLAIILKKYTAKKRREVHTCLQNLRKPME